MDTQEQSSVFLSSDQSFNLFSSETKEKTIKMNLRIKKNQELADAFEYKLKYS